MIPLKSDFCYAILNDRGMADGGARAAGFYRHDTRHLSRYVWTFDDLELIEHTATATTLTQYWSRMRNHEQEVMLERRLELSPTCMMEEIHVESWSDEAIALDLKLELAADFVDIFEVRGHKRRAPRHAVEETAVGGDRTLVYLAQDGVRSETRVKLDDGM